jgi:hypothetical protein
MGIDIFPVWAAQDGTHDIITVSYGDEDDTLVDELLGADSDKVFGDQVVFLKEEAVRELLEKYKDDEHYAPVFKHWLNSMEERGFSFIRVVINY